MIGFLVLMLSLGALIWLGSYYISMFALLIACLAISAAASIAPARSPDVGMSRSCPAPDRPNTIERGDGSDVQAIPCRNLVFRVAGSRWRLIGGRLVTIVSRAFGRADEGSLLASRSAASRSAGRFGIADLQSRCVRLQI
jgi:hypothetical protein